MLQGGVCVELVTFALAMVEMEIEFTEKTDWEIVDGCNIYAESLLCCRMESLWD